MTAALASSAIPLGFANVSALATARVTTDEAKEIAFADAGCDEGDVTKLKCKYDREDYEYEVDFRYSKADYDYSIDANGGDILAKSYELVKKDKGTSGNKIGTQKAKEIALNDAGVSSAKSIKVKLKTKKKYSYYKVTFVKDAYDYEYEINAYTSTINEAEYEIDD